jgi:hypothetical protein
MFISDQYNTEIYVIVKIHFLKKDERCSLLGRSRDFLSFWFKNDGETQDARD